ncbi:CoA-transferase subunit beta [Thermodesulfobacteriota bacterium]
MNNTDYTPIEMMILAASREIRDEETVFVGTYWPIIAALQAKRAHAPDTTLVVEGGIVTDTAPDRLPLAASDGCFSGGAVLCGDSLDTLGVILHGGHVDVALLSAAMVDKYGNINTTCIGDYEKPKVRMAGSGGASDLAALSRRLIIILEHDPRRFPERVDYITTPGYLDGYTTREEAGLRAGTGPSAVVTTLGVFRFEEDTKEMILSEYYAGIDIETIQESVGWDLKLAKDIKQAAPPSIEELRVLRSEVDPSGMYLKDERNR